MQQRGRAKKGDGLAGTKRDVKKLERGEFPPLLSSDVCVFCGSKGNVGEGGC